jgi:integrase
MARKREGFTAAVIDNDCVGVIKKKVLYRHGKYGLGLAVDRRYGDVRKTFFFEAKLHGRTIRRTIGDWPAWTVAQAEQKARGLRVKIDNGIDPREEARNERAAAWKAADEREARRATLRGAWDAYLGHRAASNKPLAALTIRDYHAHLRRSFGDWADQRLVNITGDAVVAKHRALVGQSGPAQANQAMRCLRAVLAFAMKRAPFSGCFDGENPVRRLTEDSGWAEVKPNDVTLRRNQVPEWWQAVDFVANPVARGYMRFLLRTGCRREEALSLRWTDIDFRWESITFRDVKTGGDRVIPLTRFVALLLHGLPRRNDWVFSSERSLDGRMREPAKVVKAIADRTGIWVPSHGLRRSFSTLSEWAELPSGAVRQIMGHRPGSDVHEGAYKPRPLDLLARHLQRYEDWILAEAGHMPADAAADVGLRLVS